MEKHKRTYGEDASDWSLATCCLRDVTAAGGGGARLGKKGQRWGEKRLLEAPLGDTAHPREPAGKTHTHTLPVRGHHTQLRTERRLPITDTNTLFNKDISQPRRPVWDLSIRSTRTETHVSRTSGARMMLPTILITTCGCFSLHGCRRHLARCGSECLGFRGLG